jgi:predicted GNAT family acetyltransferase
MIRKLTQADEQSVLTYLYQEPQINLFIIGDIENFGFHVDFQEVYGEFDGERYLSVLLRYKENIIYYSHDIKFNTDWLSIIGAMKFDFISGKKALTDLLYPYFSNFKEKTMYFAEATSLDPSFQVDRTMVKVAKSREEYGQIFDLLIRIEEFDSMKTAQRESYINDRMRDSRSNSMQVMIVEDDVCVSTAATVADTNKSAMIVAVATDITARNKGYASKVMIALMDEYINTRKKSLCLFFDNPKAGKIYHRLGFKDMDQWVMLVRKSD